MKEILVRIGRPMPTSGTQGAEAQPVRGRKPVSLDVEGQTAMVDVVCPFCWTINQVDANSPTLICWNCGVGSMGIS